MSVKINKDGLLEVTNNNSHLSIEGYHERLKALVDIIKIVDPEIGYHKDTMWHILDIIEDYLPTYEQCSLMFSEPEKQLERLKEAKGKTYETERQLEEITKQFNKVKEEKGFVTVALNE